MRPKPFRPEPLNNGSAYVHDLTSGLIWHRCSLRVLYADTDRSQVVYHSNYLRYFEFGRASLMREAAYPYREIEESGFVYPIIATGLEYYRPLHYDEAMVIHTRPGEMLRVKLQFDYVITHEVTGELVCTGFTRHCAINAKGTPVGIDPKTQRLWEIFPEIGRAQRRAVEIEVPSHWADHRFQGRAVLPAVEAMQLLAVWAGQCQPRVDNRCLLRAKFEKFLELPAGTPRLEVYGDLERLDDGSVRACLTTRTQVGVARITRTKIHAEAVFAPTSEPAPVLSPDSAAALEGTCFTIDPERIYRELVPFGPAFQTIQRPLMLMAEGALAEIAVPGGLPAPLAAQPLGSPLILDGAFHAACVWSQRFCDVVAFPVGIDERRVLRPTCSGDTYIGRVLPVQVTPELLRFDIRILDRQGQVFEIVKGVRMRDVSGGRLRPPQWVRAGDSDARTADPPAPEGD